MIIKGNVGQIIVCALFSINITLKKLVKCLWNICNETKRTQWRKTLQMHCVNAETNRAFDNRGIVCAGITPLKYDLPIWLMYSILSCIFSFGKCIYGNKFLPICCRTQMKKTQKTWVWSLLCTYGSYKADTASVGFTLWGQMLWSLCHNIPVKAEHTTWRCDAHSTNVSR